MVCGSRGDAARMLLCDGDGCGRGCHLYCCEPKLTAPPKGDWFCRLCKTPYAGKERKAAPKESAPAAKPVAKPAAKRAEDEPSQGADADGRKAGGGAAAKPESGKGAEEAARRRRVAAEAAASLCERLEEAMESLMGVEDFSEGMAALLEGLELVSAPAGSEGALVAASADVQRTLSGALRCARRQLGASSGAWLPDGAAPQGVSPRAVGGAGQRRQRRRRGRQRKGLLSALSETFNAVKDEDRKARRRRQRRRRRRRRPAEQVDPQGRSSQGCRRQWWRPGRRRRRGDGRRRRGF